VNGIHDMGGMHGFGPVEREPDEPVFHAGWEKRVWGLSRACVAQRVFNQDEARHGIERMDPVAYLRSSYYERWLERTVRLLVEKGVLAPDELAARMRDLAARPAAPPPAPADPTLGPRLLEALRARPAFRRPGPPGRFHVGDAVLTRRDQPGGHTRLPRYARGKRGVIDRIHGVYVFPDANAHGEGEAPHALYSVRFEAAELWGPSGQAAAPVLIDLWERYLEAGAPPARQP